MNRLARHGTSLLLILLAALASLRIADGYRVFTNTYDEPSHIAAGMEWLDTGRYTYEPKHMPMRAVYAIGPRLLGMHAFGEGDVWTEGRRILYEGGKHSYRQILTAARLAALPFFLLTLAVVGIWAARIGGSAAAVAAVFAYSMLPLALAHAGLATTDTPVTGTLALAFFAWALCLESPRPGRVLLLGVAAALAVLSKLSAVLFLGLTVVVSGLIWLLRKAGPDRRIRLRALANTLWAVPVGLFVLWAGYRFSFAPLVDDRHPLALDRLLGNHGDPHGLAHRLLGGRVPMPELVRGLQELLDHSARGATSFFMGQVTTHGHWAFFPVGIAVKTPIAFLLLAFAGLIVIARMAWRGAPPSTWIPALGALLILVSCLPSDINIGMRHVLPMFPLLAAAAGMGFAALWRCPVGARRLGPALGLVMLGWLGVSSLRAHPDYLAYFNECCQREPQRWLVDSDLDWGQDLDRLAAALKRRGVDEVYLDYFGTADTSRHGMPHIKALAPNTPVHGWVAVSEYWLAMGRNRWLDAYEPTERIGRSIRLYQLP